MEEKEGIAAQIRRNRAEENLISGPYRWKERIAFSSPKGRTGKRKAPEKTWKGERKRTPKKIHA